MRALPTALAVLLALYAVAARAEDMVAINPDGLMCRDPKALADFTAPNGSLKKGVMADPFSPTARRYMAACNSITGETVHVLTKRVNTSIVTYHGQTWYVPNIDFMTPAPDCIKDGTKLTMVGTIETAFARTDEVDPKKGYHYPRLTLDKPVCYLGNEEERAGRYVSLPTTSAAADTALTRMIGRHVTISGEVTSPETSDQPPDAMMMFDPAVTPIP